MCAYVFSFLQLETSIHSTSLHAYSREAVERIKTRVVSMTAILVPSASFASPTSETQCYSLVGTSVCVGPVRPTSATKQATARYVERVSVTYFFHIKDVHTVGPIKHPHSCSDTP